MRRIFRRIHFLLNRRRLEQELEEEMAAHREMMAAERRGAFGNTLRLREEVRETWGWMRAEQFARDAGHGIRQLRRNPAFSAIAITTLALGTGGVTAMFSAFDSILIRPLPYAGADRLVMVWDRELGVDAEPKFNTTPAEWVAWRRLNTVFTDLACTQPGDLTISGDGEPEQVPARKVTWNFWSVLGVQPMLGRAFTEDEDNQSMRVVVISHRLWQRRFGGASNIIGRKVSLNDAPYEVVGVMPRNFYFLPSREIDLWVPASFPAWMRRELSWHDAQIVARLKPGVTLEHAQQSMHSVSLEVTAKNFRGPRSVLVVPLRDEIAGKTKTALILLLCASVALLLIACVNLANLLLSRGAVRGDRPYRRSHRSYTSAWPDAYRPARGCPR